MARCGQVYSFAEGLLLPTMQDSGIAFLNAELDVRGPTFVGDTIHVESEVTEHRLTTKGIPEIRHKACDESASAARPPSRA